MKWACCMQPGLVCLDLMQNPPCYPPQTYPLQALAQGTPPGPVLNQYPAGHDLIQRLSWGRALESQLVACTRAPRDRKNHTQSSTQAKTRHHQHTQVELRVKCGSSQTASKNTCCSAHNEAPTQSDLDTPVCPTPMQVGHVAHHPVSLTPRATALGPCTCILGPVCVLPLPINQVVPVGCGKCCVSETDPILMQRAGKAHPGWPLSVPNLATLLVNHSLHSCRHGSIQLLDGSLFEIL